MHILKIKVMDECPNRDSVIGYYKQIAQNKENSSINLIVPEKLQVPVNRVTQIGLGIQCEFVTEKHARWEGGGRDYTEQESFMLIPTDLISSTPLSMANNISIIDKCYRDQLVVSVRCHVDLDNQIISTESVYNINHKDKLFKIVAFDGKPIHIKLVTELSILPEIKNKCCGW